MVVLELTKRGEPHLHIMCRSPFIRQADLSKFMKARINAPIVDIRMVKGSGEVAKYVAKYISKRPIKLGTMKRYWRSMNYFSEAIKLMRRLRPKHNAVWRIELNTVAFIQHLKANGRLLWQDHFGRICWRQYPWETAPPVTSNLVERLA